MHRTAAFVHLVVVENIGVEFLGHGVPMATATFDQNVLTSMTPSNCRSLAWRLRCEPRWALEWRQATNGVKRLMVSRDPLMPLIAIDFRGSPTGLLAISQGECFSLLIRRARHRPLAQWLRIGGLAVAPA